MEKQSLLKWQCGFLEWFVGLEFDFFTTWGFVWFFEINWDVEEHLVCEGVECVNLYKQMHIQGRQLWLSKIDGWYPICCLVLDKGVFSSCFVFICAMDNITNLTHAYWTSHNALYCHHNCKLLFVNILVECTQFGVVCKWNLCVGNICWCRKI